ncbi:hypothetical protein BGX30_006532 [Mortierella sp. GBA39]|nr:hypothetical protein BGX30_006532 [Mortierella sp. GBA39]
MDTETDVESDTDLLLESGLAGGRTTTLNPDIRLCSLSTTPVTSGTATPAPTTTTPLSTGGPAGASTGPVDDLDGSATAADLYRSTIEFLALMTAFVSVVCWLMQTRLLDGGPSNRDPSTVTAAMEGIDMEQDGPEPGRRDGCAQLREFLRLFDDLDNVLNPIKEALSQTHDSQQRWQQQHIDEQESDARLDPMDSVGLFAWHYFLFSSDRESPFEREAHAIDIPSLHLIHFDVLLNELYTTHILSMTAKEHQKDHGQFYTPPGVVDFMWKRTIIDRGRLLDQFVESMPSTLSAPSSFSQQESLIPTALDPCLGVSTFLSCYVRLLIQEAERDHAETIWRSEAACRLLLTQICENVWGIELDGFAFWMARCGILVALMPLVQHVESFSHHPHYHHHQHPQQRQQPYQQHQQCHQYQQQQQAQLPRLHLFRSDTLQLTVPDGTSPKSAWDRHCILQLRTPSRLQFDFIVTNPPYMIRKTGTFSAPDPEVYDWSILGASIATVTSAATSAAPPGLSEGSSLTLKTKSKSSTKASKNGFEEDERLTPSTVDTGDDDSGSEATMTHGGSDRQSKGATESVLQSPRTKKLATQVRPTGSKGMMQAYGYFVWFAAQRIKPGKGVVCMITASQWLTLEFAVKLRAWLFENCLMDEFFQFEPYKVFSKVQTDSLIFKIRAISPDLLPSTSPSMSSSILPLGDHRTVFLRHTDHHKPLVGILQDYMTFSSAEDPQVARSSSSSFVVGSATTTTTNSNSDLNIMVSSKTREELAAVIMAPSATPTTAAATATGKGDEAAAPATYTYSFAPMMPASVLTTYMLALTQDLGAICSAGTKKMNRLRAVEPLLWHRGPNTNPVYGLVVRMEYARAMFGEVMTSRWFRPALYWNGKNSPEGPPTTATGATGGGASGASTLAVSSKVLHREGQFWQGRDRQRLSKKEGSPAESYCVPTSDPQRMYALCMVDKESVKVLRQQVELKVEGSQALWNYLTDVRSHFQPGLASKRKVVSGGKAQAVDDEGVAFCSTNQCGADVPEKIVHPINYGYFSKTQPRQRFFLDTDSLACPPLMYFLTLLNSTTLQFFVLHHCQYDQQGRMRLFRESMAKIPFQDRDVKNCPERIRYVAELGASMAELKDMLYSVVTGWRLTGSHHSSSSGGGGVSQHGGVVGGERRGSTGGLASIAIYPAVAAGTSSTAPTSTGGSSNQGLMDWVRKGGNPPPGLLLRVKDQVRRMLIAQQASHPRHLYQDPGPAASYTAGLGGTHVTKARPSSSAPTSSSSSSILHLNKPRGFNAGAMMGIGGGGAAFFTDTDTDTNTFTDTDTDTDDTMDPWMTSRLEGHVPAGTMGRSGVYAPDYQSQSQSQSVRGQGQHSLARILNMPGDDREMSMDEKGTTTSSMPVPIPERGSRDRRPSFRATVSGGFGRDEEFDEAESKKAAVSVPVSTAMETDLDELYRHNKHHQHQQHHHQQHQMGSVASSSSFNDHQISHDSDRILQALERAITMVEMVQWAVDQYGYMLYGIRPKFQKLLELELKIIYGSRLESLIVPSTPPPSATAPGVGVGVGVGEDRRAVAASLGITAWGLYRWEGDCEPMPSHLTPALGSGPASTTSGASSLPSESAPGNNGRRQLLPTYALQVLENAQSATQLLREIFDQFPALPSLSSSVPSGPSKK